MSSALLGYTGYVGTTLRGQTSFDEQFNSANIATIDGKHYDLVICAAARAEKWLANKEPERDLAGIESLMAHLRQVTAERFVLISTVDVYARPIDVDEDTRIDPGELQPYGKHRYMLEEFVRDHFANSLVMRLPGLFGRGLKKNFLYDLLNKQCLDWTHHQSRFQFYNMANLWADIQRVMDVGLDLVNVSAEPVQAGEVARRCFDVEFAGVTERPPVSYDMHSRHAHVLAGQDRYLYSAESTFEQIRRFRLDEEQRADQ